MPPRLPPLNALRAFEAAGRHLSISKAADELHVTPAAVSHHIKALEEQLGVPLFRREPRRLLLTDAGQRLLPGLRDGFERMEAALAELRERADDGRLTVSAVPSLTSRWLLPRLDRFRRAHPDIALRLDATGHLVDFARETDVDAALRHGCGDYSGLHVEFLAESNRHPVCSPVLLKGAHPLREPADLVHHTLLHSPWSLGEATEPDWAEWLKTAGVSGVDTETGPRFSHGAYAIQAAVEGHGVALASDVLVADDIAAGRLVHPFGRGVPGRTPFAYYFVCPPHKLRSDSAVGDRVLRFRDWLRAELAGESQAESQVLDADGMERKERQE